MILHFPSLDALHLAITSGVVPSSLSMTPAVAAFDDDGQPWLEPSTSLPRTVQAGLRRLGVAVLRQSEIALTESICCWPQLLPVRRLAEPVALTAQTPVLFDLPDAEQLPELVGEMLRLGNDRQSFRWLEDGAGGQRVLLRVLGPPYYSLLRALEHEATAPRAFVERAPRVWVEIGHAHALVEHLQPPADKLLFLQPPRSWSVLDDAPYRDIYQVLDFSLPGGAVRWRDAGLARRLRVPMRLAAGSAAGSAELWVIHERPLEQLDALVRGADDRLLARLAFAVARPTNDEKGDPLVVLRVRPTKQLGTQAPPVLVLQAVSFRPYLKLPNLFLPCGTHLQPPLRRDAVRKLLADDPAQVTWLYPDADGGFVPQSLPDEAFRPLEQWVDYVLEQDHEALNAWIESAHFDFEPFVCGDEPAARPRRPRQRTPVQGEDETRRAEARDVEARAAQATSGSEAEQELRRQRDVADFAALPSFQPSELQQRRGELEQRFLELDTPLDAPERRELWRELAQVHTALGNGSDASVCWVNSLWELEAPPASWLKAWQAAEARGRGDPNTDLTSLLELPNPTTADARTLAASITCAAVDDSAPRTLPLDRIQRFLEKHEGMLPLRAAWLAWVAVVQLARGDVLALARTRDRLLERLYHSGLTDTDLPGFLRFSGQHRGERFQIVRDRVMRLHELTQLWIKIEKPIVHYGPQDKQLTHGYVDLLFAFGLARLGESALCTQLVEQANDVLEQRDEAHTFLRDAFLHRIRQVSAGKPHAGPLPDEQLTFLDELHEQKRAKNQPNLCHVVEKLRQKSTVLEPHDKYDAYRRSKKYHDDPLETELARLPDIVERERLTEVVQRLLQSARADNLAAGARMRLLAAVLQVAPRLGEAASIPVLTMALAALEKLPSALDAFFLTERLAPLLERGLFVAAHFGRGPEVQQFVAHLSRLFDVLQNTRSPRVEALVGQSFRGLRKLGLRDESERLLQQLAELILMGQSLAEVKERLGVNWPTALCTLLHVAAGWLYFGQHDAALPVLDAARELLAANTLPPHDKVVLACNYLTTLGQAPIELALERVEELFRRAGRITDAMSTNSHYNLYQLQVVEALVLAVVNDEFALGAEVRRWLDDDEYLVRRRIHRELKQLLGQAGL